MNQAKLVKIRAYDVTGRRVVGKGPSRPRLERSVLRILKENMLCSMATLTPRNRPHISTAYFCWSDSLEVYFLSHPGSLHCRNLSTNRSLGMTIFSSSQGWARPGRGLQLFGTCSQAQGSDAMAEERWYARRFPDYPRWRATLGQEDMALGYRFYRFLPSRLKVLDEAAFGDAVFVVAEVSRG